jgi:hypothetical protein
MSKPTVEDRGQDIAGALGDLMDVAVKFASVRAGDGYLALATSDLGRAAMRYAAAVRRAINQPAKGAR